MNQATVGQTNSYIQKWDKYDERFFVPRLKKKPKRATPPGGKTAWADDFSESARVSRIKDLKERKLSAALHLRDKYDKEILQLQKESIDYQGKRARLTKWENMQMGYCINGMNFFTGFLYFYFNFVWIRSLKKGTEPEKDIQPNYRQVDNYLSRVYEWCIENNIGMIMVKRRRLGATWLAAALCVYLCIFRSSVILFCSHNNPDIDKFLRRVKFINDRLPPFLRLEEVTDAHNKKAYITNARVAEYLGIDLDKRMSSELNTANANNESNFAGEGSSLVLFDEIGENPNLENNLTWVDPQLMDETGLGYAGVKFLFGTVGDMRKAGSVVKQIFYAADAYDMIPIFMKGYYGTKMDQFGNDKVHEAISIIQDKRDKYDKAGLTRKLNQYKQQFPLKIEDCWIIDDSESIWPIAKIQLANDFYPKHRKIFKYGIFHKDYDGKIMFSQQEPREHIDPNKDGWIGYGQWIMLEDRIYQANAYNHPYVAGCDPLDLSKLASSQVAAISKTERYSRSDISCVIVKRFAELGGIGNFPVAMYCGRPHNMNEAFEQIKLGIRYYSSPINIERNRGSSLVYYLEEERCEDLVIYGQVGQKYGETSEKAGFYKNETWESNMVTVMEKWWQEHYMKPLPFRIIAESTIFSPGKINTDACIAWMAAMQVVSELDELAKGNNYSNKKDIRSQDFNGTFHQDTNGIWMPTVQEEDWMMSELKRNSQYRR